MDNVRDRLLRNQADEFREHSFSFGSLMAGAIGPDGGMAATHPIMTGYDIQESGTPRPPRTI